MSLQMDTIVKKECFRNAFFIFKPNCVQDLLLYCIAGVSVIRETK